jgi:membrane protease YdiL (CAAX protease family)
MSTLETLRLEATRFPLSEHPWISLAALWITGILVLILVAIAASLVGVSENAPYRPLITPTLAHILVLFVIVPFGLQLPNGKTTLRKYLDAIRLSRIRPCLPLLALGVSSSLILLLCLAVNSLIYRLSQGLPLNLTFLSSMIDLRADLPPASLSYIVAFPAIFEEVSWRGVMLVVFMKRYSAKASILITALGFGLFHFLNLLSGLAPDFVIRQVIFGTALGFFYGYLVLRADSLLPAMLFHYLVNMFIGSFTIYFQRHAPASTQILYTLINLPLTASLLILWVRVFSQRWIPRPASLTTFNLWRRSK